MNSGIYRVRNRLNNNCYIGSAVDIRARWRRHRSGLNHQLHENTHLQRAWNKYGVNTFIFEILEICEPQLCIEREQRYLDVEQPEYNICQIAGNRLGVKHSLATRQKMSEARLGRLFSDKHKKNLAASLRGKGANITPTIARGIKQDIARGICNKDIVTKRSVTVKVVEGIKYGHSWKWLDLEGLGDD